MSKPQVWLDASFIKNLQLTVLNSCHICKVNESNHLIQAHINKSHLSNEDYVFATKFLFQFTNKSNLDFLKLS